MVTVRSQDMPLVIREMQQDELVDFRENLEGKMVDIKVKIDSACENGFNAAGLKWRRNAQIALAHTKTQHQMSIRELSRRKKAAAEEWSLRFERRFIEAAKSILPSDKYKELLDKAVD